MNTQITTRELVKMAMCLAVISVSAYIAFPLPFTPAMVVASTAAMCLTAFVLTPRQTFITLVAYLILGGVAGLPILPGGTGGLGRLLGPTGGFYFAWVIAYTVVSVFKGSNANFKRYCLTGIFISIPLVYVGGVISMMMVMDIGIEAAIMQAVLPFIPGDVLKCILAAFLGVRINNALGSE
ncbi:MAG: biotin transporter BioY [Anaerovibrio sp.]|uniref:biotin transporter BioY n=1 Tax=Anaerovibrio sp. TaxID=1872532 RepID=UPI0025E905D0|nr:biotin transporter BioY [Anaerovibrio sp.]MCR5176671.1 biotin transporter BioY [Anaerovibrio sp.]